MSRAQLLITARGRSGFVTSLSLSRKTVKTSVSNCVLCYSTLLSAQSRGLLLTRTRTCRYFYQKGAHPTAVRWAAAFGISNKVQNIFEPCISSEVCHPLSACSAFRPLHPRIDVFPLSFAKSFVSRDRVFAAIRIPYSSESGAESRNGRRHQSSHSQVSVKGSTMASGEQPVRSYQIVIAALRNMGIGVNGGLPWNLPLEMKFFSQVTSRTRSPSKKNAVIQGRRSWDALPKKYQPLKNRLNVILSRTLRPGDVHEPTLVCDSLDSALTLLATPPYASEIETVFVIGGAEILRESMSAPLCDAIHLTEIDADIECDTFSPPVDRSIFTPWYTSAPVVENNMRYSFVTYVRRGRNRTNNGQQSLHGIAVAAAPQNAGEGNSSERSEDLESILPECIVPRHEEYQYLNLIEDIIQNGTVKGDRTGTGTISKFGCQMRFNLRKSFPLLTTKRVHWRGIVEELLWFISGSTNAKVLQDKDVHIWDGNSTKEYLSSIGLPEREEGDLGPVYGFQWRHFGAKYTDMHADYSGQGFDQLADVIHKIRTNPNDRRIMLSAWNPADLHLMALPPCHMFAQFYVANGELSCQMYQRSCDMGLGVPYNIASYSLLTYMIAHVCDLVPGDFVHVLGDAHVYANHVEPLEKQLKNRPKPFPELRIKSSKRDIDSFTADDFELIGYQSSGRIAMKMAV